MKLGILKNDVNFINNIDIFLNHHKNIYISREDILNIKAYTVDLQDYNNNILSTIGEFFEREILISKDNINDYVNCFSLLDGSIKKLKKNSLIFIDKFVDSCGMASHINSDEVIFKSFCEFFERQIFIYNFLSKSKSKKIKINYNYNLYKYNCYLKNFVDEVNFFDISLVDDLYIIVGLGSGKNKCIGLGTSTSLSDAINKAQKEMLQYFASSTTKYKNNLGFNINKNKIDDLYHLKFEKLTNKEFEKEYKYLFENCNEFILKNERLEENKFNLNKFIIKINNHLGMNPYLAFFKNKRNLSNLKITKVIDTNWFPNMNPKLFDIKTIKYIENITSSKLDTRCEYIPFP